MRIVLLCAPLHTMHSAFLFRFADRRPCPIGRFLVVSLKVKLNQDIRHKIACMANENEACAGQCETTPSCFSLQRQAPFHNLASNCGCTMHANGHCPPLPPQQVSSGWRQGRYPTWPRSLSARAGKGGAALSALQVDGANFEAGSVILYISSLGKTLATQVGHTSVFLLLYCEVELVLV